MIFAVNSRAMASKARKLGINVTIMDNAVIGVNCIVATHSIVPEGAQIPEISIVAGVPGMVVKSHRNLVANCLNAFVYNYNGKVYARGDYRTWDTEVFRQARAAEQAILDGGISGLGSTLTLGGAQWL